MIFTELKTGKEIPFLPMPTVFALGNFDGIHIGHRKVLEKAIEESRKEGAECVAWCLSSPSAVEKQEVLCTRSEKTELLLKIGCEYAVFEDFNLIKDMTPERFVFEYLSSGGCVSAVCGFNFKFGKGAVGDSETLNGLCRENGMKSYTVEAALFNGKAVSSTVIRNLISNGNVAEAEKLLSYPYSFSGCVTAGRHLGKSFGFPTVNLSFEEGKCIPKRGVYFSLTEIGGKVFKSVSNVGCRPTVGGHSVRLETHIIGADGELYGEKVKVSLKEFRREEKKFSTKQNLICAIAEDKRAAEKYFGEHPDFMK